MTEPIQKNNEPADFTVVPIPLKVRRKKAVILFGVTFAILAWTLRTLYQEDQLGVNLVGLVPIALLGFGGSIYSWRKTEEQKATPAKVQRDRAHQEEQERKQREFDDK